MFDDKLKPTTAGEVVLGSARVEAEAKRRRDFLSPGDRQRAGTMAERVRGPAPEYMSEVGAGGELVPASMLCENSRALEFRDTVSRPDYISVDASRDRLELANAAGALESGLDLADTIGARDSAEKMLAHQMAAVHRASMKMMAQVNRNIEHLECVHPTDERMLRLQALNQETCRLAGTAMRLMNTYQQGMLAVHRLRTGGTQRGIIERMQQVNQRVTVEDGGQAVVAGEVSTGGRGRRKRTGGEIKNGQ
jgi:hypothetical protein